ncbi:MAG: hypothetical protein D6712_14270 [Chloroflexi bacterium]|nr:MAG: hypothetical protein D6712_14270 [Chloroflexota bacterium]
MNNQLIEFAIDGDIQLHQFSTAINDFKGLLEQLVVETVPEEKIVWRLADLQFSSAIMILEPQSPKTEATRVVIEAFEAVARFLTDNRNPFQFSAALKKQAQKLANFTRESGIEGMRFSVNQRDYILQPLDLSTPMPEIVVSWGTLKGRMQSISSRRQLRITVYDALFDKAVICYLTEDWRHKLPQLWDKDVIVSGKVTRRRDTGQPVSVRQITDIQPVADFQSGDYKQARGALVRVLGDENAEESIRRLRDA